MSIFSFEIPEEDEKFDRVLQKKVLREIVAFLDSQYGRAHTIAPQSPTIPHIEPAGWSNTTMVEEPEIGTIREVPGTLLIEVFEGNKFGTMWNRYSIESYERIYGKKPIIPKKGETDEATIEPKE